MIKITVVEPTSAAWLKWRTKCKAKTNRDIQQFKRTKKVKTNSALYKAQQKFFVDPSGLFGGKCAYCEAYIDRQWGQIEHYRPKAAVADEDNATVFVKYDRKRIPHPEYYWLAYEWRNLLPACEICNGSGGKGTRFPVQGRYAVARGQEHHEDPLLLHPFVDDPDTHLELDGACMVVEKSERGRVTIKVMGLNDPRLVRRRLEKYQDTTKKVRLAFIECDQNNLRSEVDKIRSERQEFSCVAYKAVEDERQAILTKAGELAR
jgi:hypothetical protein